MQTHYHLKVTNTQPLLIVGLHGLAFLLVLATDYTVPYSLLFSFLILLSLYCHLPHRHHLAAHGDFDGFIFEGDRMLFYSGEKCICQGQVLSPTLVTPYFILFNLRIDGVHTGTRVLLGRDDLGAEPYRRLSVSVRLA